MNEQMSIFDFNIEQPEQKEDYPCARCDVANGSMECFLRMGFFWSDIEHKWLRDRNGNLLRSGKRDCDYEYKEAHEEEDTPEEYCRDCKHSYQRSEFDIMDKGKWAYRFVCTLTDEYVQTCHSCGSWESRDE